MCLARAVDEGWLVWPLLHAVPDKATCLFCSLLARLPYLRLPVSPRPMMLAGRRASRRAEVFPFAGKRQKVKDRKWWCGKRENGTRQPIASPLTHKVERATEHTTNPMHATHFFGAGGSRRQQLISEIFYFPAADYCAFVCHSRP